MPCCANSSDDSVRVPLLVQRSGDSGSPRVSGSTSFSSAGHTSGCSTSYGLSPVLRRTLTTSSGRAPARTSSRPFLTVLMAMPVARATAATPPYPITSASAPAHNRRARSSIVGLNRRHFWPTNSSEDIRFVDHVCAILSIPYERFAHENSIELLIRSPIADGSDGVAEGTVAASDRDQPEVDQRRGKVHGEEGGKGAQGQ